MNIKQKHKAASLVSVLMFMLVATFVTAEIFLLFQWTNESITDHEKFSVSRRELENKIAVGKAWLAEKHFPGKNREININKGSIKFDDSIRFIDGDILSGVYIYDLSFDVSFDAGRSNSSVNWNTGVPKYERYFPSMPGRYLLRALNETMMLEVVTSMDSGKLKDIMRHEELF